MTKHRIFAVAAAAWALSACGSESTVATHEHAQLSAALDHMPNPAHILRKIKGCDTPTTTQLDTEGNPYAYCALSLSNGAGTLVTAHVYDGDPRTHADTKLLRSTNHQKVIIGDRFVVDFTGNWRPQYNAARVDVSAHPYFRRIAATLGGIYVTGKP